MKKTLIQDISVVDALDNLTSMTDLDLGLVRKQLEALKSNHEVIYFSKWLDLNDQARTLENVKLTFRGILDYLKELAKKEKETLKGEDTQKGIRSMMILAEEAASKVDKLFLLYDKSLLDRSIKESKEFQDLKEFYHKKLLKKLQKKEIEKELWEETLEEEGLDEFDIKERGLKDLETVKADAQYELFLIKKEDGKPFFNKNLMRHIKLIHDFDKIIVSQYEQDPFLLAERVRDRGAFASAKEIKEKIISHIGHFLKTHEHQSTSEFYQNLSSALHALILATSTHNLIEEGGRKSCFQYFSDFSLFIKESLLSTDYHANKGIGYEDLTHFMRDLMELLNRLSLELFLHVGSKDQMIGLINILMDQVGKHEKQKKPLSKEIWISLLEGNKHLNDVLKKYPNGPLFKLIEHFQISKESQFEPLAQSNYPSLLYSFQNKQLHLSVLRMPSPTRQEVINKAEPSILFEGFIRALNMDQKHAKLLLLNLQDRTCWQDHARCSVIEGLPKRSEYVDTIEVCTLAKCTSFYKQTEEYLGVQKGSDFIRLLKEQFSDPKECGFYFPSSLDLKQLNEFVEKSTTMIYHHFFAEKENLSRKNRLDFIEIFYFFLTLKLIDLLRPSLLTMSCKDAIDTGPGAYSAFFAFLKICSEDDVWSKEELDFFLWMMQSPALLQRERAIHSDRFERAVSALEIFHAELEINKAKILKDFESLYSFSIFKDLTVAESR